MKILVDEPVRPDECPFAAWDDLSCICGIPAARGKECECDYEEGCPYLVYENNC